MTKVSGRKWTIIAGAALFALSAAPSAQSQPNSPQVVEGSGERAQGFFTAGPDGAVIAMPGNARLDLEPGASVRVFGSPQQLTMPEKYSVPTWSVAVRAGRVRATVPKPKKIAILLTVSEKFSTVIAHGTGMLLLNDGSQETTAANLKGDSYTIIGGHWQKLAANEIRSLKAGATSPVTQHTLAPTNILPGRRVWVSPGGSVKVEGVKWQPIDGAVDYTVTLSRLGETEPVATVRTTEPSLASAVGPLSPGQYSLAVRANDGRGLPGRWSQPVELRVLGVELPAGAYVSSSGIINLAQGQQARFTNAEGLELIYSGARRYIPASSEVPLHEGRRTLVSFRKPGCPDIAMARLEPRSVSADVEIGPVTAKWPRDTVEVSVRLKTTSKDTPLETIEPRPKVMVGIDPVEVDWRWEGSELKAVIPPSKRQGPWVIRVEVEDQYGLALGRNMLEVIPSGPSSQRRKPGAPPDRISHNR